MALFAIDHHPSKSQLRVFAATWLGFFLAAGILFAVRGHLPIAWACWSLAPLAALLLPTPLTRLLYLAMSYATYPVGVVISWLLFALVYYGVLTPIGGVLKLLGYDPLKRRFDATQTSYWEPHRPPTDPKRYFRQF